MLLVTFLIPVSAIVLGTTLLAERVDPVIRLERGDRVRWQIPNPPDGEYWAPRDTTLRRDPKTRVFR